MGVVSRGKNWKSLKPLAKTIHAPRMVMGVMSKTNFCRSESSLSLAGAGDTVTCLGCLRKLSRFPNYANLLRMQHDIRMSGEAA